MYLAILGFLLLYRLFVEIFVNFHGEEAVITAFADASPSYEIIFVPGINYLGFFVTHRTVHKLPPSVVVVHKHLIYGAILVIFHTGTILINDFTSRFVIGRFYRAALTVQLVFGFFCIERANR
jgi:hypothetical protein